MGKYSFYFPVKSFGAYGLQSAPAAKRQMQFQFSDLGFV